MPPSNPEGVAEKLAFFAKHKDEFDTFFLGSSRFHYALSPERFDTITRENGVPTRTFNFGVDGMSPPETFYVLEQILKTQPRNLKWVFLEFDNIQTKLHADILGTQRLLYWHDWPRTALTLRKAVDPSGQGKWYQKLNRLWSARRNLLSHLALFQKQFANAGRGAELFSRPSEVRRPRIEPEAGAERRRLSALRSTDVPGAAPRISGANWPRRLPRRAPNSSIPYAEGAYRDYAAKLRQLGAGLIFVVPPSIFQSPMLFRATPPPGPLFAFNDCKTYPQLCDTKVRVDEQHLTDEGAAEFTRLLALEFVGFARRP